MAKGQQRSNREQKKPKQSKLTPAGSWVAVRRNAGEVGRSHSREEEVASEPYELIAPSRCLALSRETEQV